MTDLQKMIAETQNEITYFIDVQNKSETGQEAMRYRIEEIKRHYLLEKLQILQVLGYE